MKLILFGDTKRETLYLNELSSQDKLGTVLAIHEEGTRLVLCKQERGGRFRVFLGCIWRLLFPY